MQRNWTLQEILATPEDELHSVIDQLTSAIIQLNIELEEEEEEFNSEKYSELQNMKKHLRAIDYTVFYRLFVLKPIDEVQGNIRTLIADLKGLVAWSKVCADKSLLELDVQPGLPRFRKQNSNRDFWLHKASQLNDYIEQLKDLENAVSIYGVNS